MNDKNHSQDKDDLSSDNSLWAKFVDQRGQVAHSENPEAVSYTHLTLPTTPYV